MWCLVCSEESADGIETAITQEFLSILGGSHICIVDEYIIYWKRVLRHQKRFRQTWQLIKDDWSMQMVGADRGRRNSCRQAPVMVSGSAPDPTTLDSSHRTRQLSYHEISIGRVLIWYLPLHFHSTSSASSEHTRPGESSVINCHVTRFIIACMYVTHHFFPWPSWCRTDSKPKLAEN